MRSGGRAEVFKQRHARCSVNSLGVGAAVVDDVIGYLSEPQSLPAKVAGVPIGPVASSVSGTIG